jgi:hypothetical protein
MNASATATAFIAKLCTTYACAWTVCTIARIAGKLARSAWWPVERTETGRLELTVSSDPRLLAGVSAAVNHFAECAGLNEAARAGLVAAFEDAFHEVFATASRNSTPVRMSIFTPTGKIEAVLVYHVENARAERVEKIRSLLAGKLDSVMLESSGETVRLDLVKNLSSSRKKR